MAGITLIDFKCDCGHEWEHLFRTKADIVNYLPCPECAQEAHRVWTAGNFIHPTHSSQYGKMQPAFGEVVRDYAHKQELLKKYDVIESSDPVGGSRCRKDWFKKPKPRTEPSSTFAVSAADVADAKE